VADGLDELPHQGPPVLAVGFAVGANHPLVDAPGRLDLDMLLDEQPVPQLGLAVQPARVTIAALGLDGGEEGVGGRATWRWRGDVRHGPLGDVEHQRVRACGLNVAAWPSS